MSFFLHLVGDNPPQQRGESIGPDQPHRESHILTPRTDIAETPIASASARSLESRRCSLGREVGENDSWNRLPARCSAGRMTGWKPIPRVRQLLSLPISQLSPSMKLDLSTTFLNGEEDLTAALIPPARPVPWGRRALIVLIVLAVVVYLALVSSALRNQFRFGVSPLNDGWFRITDRERKFQVDLPASPKQRTQYSEVEYHLLDRSPRVTVRSYSVARELLNKSATKTLQDLTQASNSTDTVKVLDSGLLNSKSHWMESIIPVASAEGQCAMRRRLMIHNKQLLEVTMFGLETEVMAADATRIMKSAQWLDP